MFNDIWHYTLRVAVLFTALHRMRILLTMFAFLGGAIAIDVGFGAQNIINNFISGAAVKPETCPT